MVVDSGNVVVLHVHLDKMLTESTADDGELLLVEVEAVALVEIVVLREVEEVVLVL